MNTSTRLVRTLRAELAQLSFIDRVRVTLFIARLYLRRLPQWWLKKQLRREVKR